MSHQVRIDYQAIGIECESICEVAEGRLKQLEKMVEEIEKGSASLANKESERLANLIKDEREKLSEQIESVRTLAKQNAKMGTVMALDASGSRQVIYQAQELRRSADELASKRIPEFEGLMHSLLSDSLKANMESLMRDGQSVMSKEMESKLESIEDEALRQYAYIAYLENPSLGPNEIEEAGRKCLDKTYEDRLEEERERIRNELKAARIDEKAIEKATSVSEGSAEEQIARMQEAASKEIVDEKIRQKSLKIIASAIKDRGFVVDQRNIKLKRDTNEVIFVALKASGEKAEFRIFLDGRFIYHFQGYEGQACQKDIEPFMKDLEEVYGIKVKHSEEIWRNPDKISSMKYQSMNVNKNKG